MPTDPRLEGGIREVGIRDLPFKSAILETIPDAGHMMHFEAPAALAAHIEAFFVKHL